MTCSENLRRLIRTARAGWIPFTLDVGAIPGFTAPVLKTFRRETASEQPEEFFDYDFRTVSLKARFAGDDPAILHDSVAPGTTFDEWGIGHWAGGAEATYEKTFPPLSRARSSADIERLPAPVIEPGQAAETVRGYHDRGYPVFGYAGSVYEWSWWLRGMEQFMADMLTDPSLVEAVLRKVSAYTRRLALESARAGIDVLCFYDDAGMQTGLQIAPELWRRFVKPCWRDILDSVRAEYPDAIFFLHSCGKIDEIIPDIIDVGFDILHPVQPECMDLESLAREFGRDLVLCASISSQRVFPFGRPDDVRSYVRRAADLFSKTHRTILCPSNLIQPETPWENILAFVEEARVRNRG